MTSKTESVLLSPDPYFTSSGEKVITRYNLGEGETKNINFNKLMDHILNLQKKKRIHLQIGENCTDFILDLEKFVKNMDNVKRFTEISKINKMNTRTLHNEIFDNNQILLKNENLYLTYQNFIFVIMNFLLNFVFLHFNFSGFCFACCWEKNIG
jgi:hypothetical protein